jgi:Amt family ammonium transporter
MQPAALKAERAGGWPLRRFLSIAFVVLLLVAFWAPAALAGDPTGQKTGSKVDITAAKAGSPTPDEVADQVGKNKVGINFVWTIVAAALVFFMQAGFALVETGFTRAKNANHTAAMNLMVFLVGLIGYLAVGFAFQFGNVGALGTLGGTDVLNAGLKIGDWNILGLKGFLLSGDAYDVAVAALFFFQLVFMDTAVTIPTGAMAERVKFSAVIASSFFISMILYPIFGNWVWGGGWLAQLGAKLGLGNGAVDFAGSGVVHAIGGMAALAGALVLGPRIGKFRKDGTPNTLPAHNLPMAVLGTIILFFGWFGFNAGSTLAGTDLRFAMVATNTMIAGALGGFVALMYQKATTGKFDTGMMCNGVLAGLVAITAPCAFVRPWAAAVIGAIAGVWVVVAYNLLEGYLKLDDPVGAVAVHGANGIWGILAVGLFADGTYGAGLNGVSTPVTGLFYGGGFGQLAAQLIDVAVILVWGFGLSYLFYKAYDKLFGMRVSAEDELRGLDLPEMGALAYPDFQWGADHTGALSGVEQPAVPIPAHQAATSRDFDADDPRRAVVSTRPSGRPRGS